KFEYVRGAVELSSGMMVKLICLGCCWSAMRKSVASIPHVNTSILPHDPHDDALHLHLVGVAENRLHRGVRRLKPDFAAWLAIEFFQGDLGPAEQRNHHLAVVGALAILDYDEIPIADLLVDHRIAADAEDVRVALAGQILRHGDRFIAGDRFDWEAGRDI